jgi:arylsulfatase A-like enzyme
VDPDIHLDHQLGILFDQLEVMNRLDTTSILLLSDHGDLLGDHGCYGKEERHYDATSMPWGSIKAAAR